jgi:hypothetical protein
LVFYKLLKLIMSYVLNRGIKDAKLQNVSVSLNDHMGTYKLGVGVVIAVEPKGVLTPKEIRRKRMIILFLVSLAIMVGLSTLGAWLPDFQAGLGRTLILLSEIPAFAYSLISTRFLMKKGPRKNVAP